MVNPSELAPPDGERPAPMSRDAIEAHVRADPFSILDLLPGAAVIVDREWCIVARNTAALGTSAAPREEVIGALLWQAWPFLGQQELLPKLEPAMRERRPVAITHHGHDREQREIWLEVHASPFADGLAIAMHDVTGQKLLQQAARDNEDRLKRALDATGALVYELDLATDEVTIAGHAMPITGVEADEHPTAEAWWKAQMHPEDFHRVAAELRASQARGDDRFAAEYRLRRLDGVERYVWDHGVIIRDETGRATGTLGTIVDITERKRREERAELLQQLTAALSAALEPEDAARVIIERAMPAIGANAGNVYLLDNDGRDLVSVASLGYAPEIVESTHTLPLGGASMMADVARSGEPIIVGSWEERVGRYPHHRHIHALGGDRAVAGLPLIVEGRAIGALSLAFPTDRTFDDDDRRFMATVADLCAQALERAQLYEALRHSEAQARLVTDRAPTYLAHVDAESRYLYVNRAYAGRFGLTPEEVVGRTMPEIVGDEAYETLRAHIERALGGEEVEFEAEVPYKGLGARFMQIAYAPDRDEQGSVRGAIAVGSDFTDRQQAEASRRFLAEVSATLTGSMNAVETLRRVARLVVPTLADYCFFDLVQPDGASRRVAWAHANPEEEAQLDERLAEFAAEALHPSHPIARAIATGRPQFLPVLSDAWAERVAASDEHLRFVRERRLRSQITVPLPARGRILGALTLCHTADSGRRYTAGDLDLARDLAERTALAVDNARLYTEALEAEAKVRRLLDAGVIGIVVADHDQILEANDHFLAMAGYSRTALAGGELRWGALTPPEYDHLDDRAIAELQDEGIFTPFEKELFRRDGSRLPILIGGAVLQREPFLWICFILDLTEQKRGENEWRAFIDAIAHDLRNPLTAVLGQTQLMQRRLRRTGALQPADAEERLTAVASAATRAASLIDDLIDTARLRASQPLEMHATHVDLVALVRTCVAEAQRVGRSHRICLECDEPSLEIAADARRIERVVRNMLDNAIKYSPAGGDVTARLSRQSGKEGAWAILEIADQGLGIPEADLTRIFERFGRGSNVAASIEGSGIGLTGARQIAEQHGGTITVHSAIGEGSTFTLRLPLRPSAGAE
jgi:PAS domain S-box-containing protein